MTTDEIMQANKQKNIDRLTAINSRMGIGRPMPRSVKELISLVGYNPLIEAVEIPAVDDEPT
jgi:hypothetical protein